MSFLDQVRGFPHFFHFLFVIVVSFPFTSPSLSLSRSTPPPPLPQWSCPQHGELNSDWRNGAPVCPAPVTQVCGNPPEPTRLLFSSLACAPSVKCLQDTPLGLPADSYQAHNKLEADPSRRIVSFYCAAFYASE